MRGMTRTAMAVLVTAGALAGCSTGQSAATPSGSATYYGIEPTGTSVTIDSVRSAQGSTAVTVAGVTLEIPQGFTSSTTTLDSGIKQLMVRDPAQTRAVVTLTVTPVPRADNTAVDASSRAAEGRLAATPGWSDVTLSPATWKGFAYATAVRATLTQADGSKRDVILVTSRDAAGTKTVGVSAEAAHGQLEGSPAFAILRTLRFAG